jgi:hypothetical protein
MCRHNYCSCNHFWLNQQTEHQQVKTAERPKQCLLHRANHITTGQTAAERLIAVCFCTDKHSAHTSDTQLPSGTGHIHNQTKSVLARNFQRMPTQTCTASCAPKHRGMHVRQSTPPHIPFTKSAAANTQLGKTFFCDKLTETATALQKCFTQRLFLAMHTVVTAHAPHPQAQPPHASNAAAAAAVAVAAASRAARRSRFSRSRLPPRVARLGR